MQTMPCKYRRITGFCLLFFIGFRSYAQEGGGARVYAAEGGEFVLTAGGQRTVYGAESLGPGGFSLHNGDVIQTGPESFVEILLNSGERVLKIAENTFFSYNVTGEGAVSLGLSYGRLRLADGKSGIGGTEVFIRSGTAEAVFRGGDIGVDYIVRTARERTSPEPVLRVYVFSGSAGLIPLVWNSPADHREITVPRFQVNALEEVSVEITASLSYIERKPLNRDIIVYWDRHTSAAFSPLSPEDPAPSSEALSAGETQVQPPAGQTWAMSPEYNPFIKSAAAKNSLLIAGLSLSFIGAGLEGAAQSSWNTGNTNNQNLNRYTGYGFLGLGALCFVAALFVHPVLPVPNAAE
jgi:hypothetical protein